MTAVSETLAGIDAELEQHVTWDGRSDDAASSSATDLDDDRGPCTECGYDPSDCDGLDHDAWSADFFINKTALTSKTGMRAGYVMDCYASQAAIIRTPRTIGPALLVSALDRRLRLPARQPLRFGQPALQVRAGGGQEALHLPHVSGSQFSHDPMIGHATPVTTELSPPQPPAERHEPDGASYGYLIAADHRPG